MKRKPDGFRKVRVWSATSHRSINKGIASNMNELNHHKALDDQSDPPAVNHRCQLQTCVRYITSFR
jgi:hypothetical protein